MSDTLIVFKANIGFQDSPLVKEHGLAPGIEVQEVSFSLASLTANRPLVVTMKLVDIHGLPLFVEQLLSRAPISAELDFYDRRRLEESSAGAKGIKVGEKTYKYSIFLSVSSASWRVVDSEFSAHEHAPGGVLSLTLSVAEGHIYSFVYDDKGGHSSHATGWGSRN